MRTKLTIIKTDKKFMLGEEKKNSTMFVSLQERMTNCKSIANVGLDFFNSVMNLKLHRLLVQ